MTRTSWIHRIRNHDRLKKAFDNLKIEYHSAINANTRKKKELTAQQQTMDQLKRSLFHLRAEVEQLNAKISIMSKEPERKTGCDKPRIDTDEAAKIIRDRVSNNLRKPMYYYHCRICPPSPLTHQRYYHLTSKASKDNCR